MHTYQHEPATSGIISESRAPLRVIGRAVLIIRVIAIYLVLAFSAAGQSNGGEQPCSTNIFDRCHTSLSRSVVDTAVWFDALFGDERYEEEVRSARLRLKPSVRISGSDDSPKVRVGVRAKVPLPRLEQRVQLILDSIVTDEDLIEDDTHIDSTVGGTEGDFDLIAAVRFILRDRPHSHLNLDLGMKVHSDDIEPFVRLRARTLSGGDIWAMRFTQRVFWLESEGFGETSRIDLDWQPRDHTFFRATTEVTWSEETEGVDIGQSLSLFRHFNDRGTAAGLILSGEAQTDPGRIEATAVAFRFRQPLNRKWLFLEIEPGTEFHHEDNYEADPYIKLGLDIILGQD